MHIWTIQKWINHVPKTYICEKSYIRIRSDKGIDVDLKTACRNFVLWAKKEYYFPLPIRIYLKSQETFRAFDGDDVVGAFFEPSDYLSLPYIKVATGDYLKMVDLYGRDDAIATILTVIAHEMTHYFQWVNGLSLTDRGRERQAIQYSHFILAEYAETRDHP